MKIILASGSPRRKELLQQINLVFDVEVSDEEEVITTDIPKDAVVSLAKQKAKAVFDKIDDEVIVIGADTVVALDDKILGKPKDEKDAQEMLQQLSGREHFVYTGVAVYKRQNGETKEFSFYEKTQVSFYPMTAKEIGYYISTEEPMDKAGAYGIQGIGASFIKKIKGDYNNVVGLPIARLYQEIQKRGIEIFPVSYYDRKW